MNAIEERAARVKRRKAMKTLTLSEARAILRNGDTSWLLKKYGVLRGEWREMIRKAVLIEREERYCEIAARRMWQGVLDFGTANGKDQ